MNILSEEEMLVKIYVDKQISSKFYNSNFINNDYNSEFQGHKTDIEEDALF